MPKPTKKTYSIWNYRRGGIYLAMCNKVLMRQLASFII